MGGSWVEPWRSPKQNRDTSQEAKAKVTLIKGLLIGKCKVPVGRAALGRIINVIGEPIDERGDIKTDQHLPIHREAPTFVEQATEQHILSTGIKAVNLLAPYQRGGKIGLFGGARVGKTVLIMELINNVAKANW